MKSKDQLQAVYDWLMTHHPIYGKGDHGQGSEELLAGCNSVLDVGCGKSPYAARVKQFHDMDRAVGCDLSPHCKEAIEGSGAEFVCCRAQSLPFPDDSFDAVVSFDVLEHLPPEDVRQALGELVRVARVKLVLKVAEDAATAPVKGVVTPLHLTIQPLSWWVEQVGSFQKVRGIARNRLMSTWLNSKGQQQALVDFLEVLF